MIPAQEKRKKRFKILAAAGGAFLVVFLALWSWVFLLPGLWHPIDFFSPYQGMLDSPIAKITIWYSGHEVTITDEDLIDRWEEGLDQLQLQKTAVDWRDFYYPLLWIGGWSGSPNDVVVQTQTGTYTILFREEQIYLGAFTFTINDGDNFPIEETYDLAVERHGLDDPG